MHSTLVTHKALQISLDRVQYVAVKCRFSSANGNFKYILLLVYDYGVKDYALSYTEHVSHLKNSFSLLKNNKLRTN